MSKSSSKKAPTHECSNCGCRRRTKCGCLMKAKKQTPAE
jgi:hypothetical protein